MGMGQGVWTGHGGIICVLQTILVLFFFVVFFFLCVCVPW